MDRFDENATGLFHDYMPLYPAAYFNNMCNRELYGWIMFERHGLVTPIFLPPVESCICHLDSNIANSDVPVADPENLSDEFKARAKYVHLQPSTSQK